MISPDCMGLQLRKIKFYSKLWASNAAKCFYPRWSCIKLNTDTSSFFIIGGPYEKEKSLFPKLAYVAGWITAFKKTLYEKHQTLILPQKTHFIRNKLRSNFHCVSYKHVFHFLLQIGQCCRTAFHSNQAKPNRYQLISSCQLIHVQLYNYVLQKSFHKALWFPFLPYKMMKIAAGFCCHFLWLTQALFNTAHVWFT